MLRRLFIMTNISNSRTIGEIKFFPVDTPPAHTLVCNGGAVSRTAYAELFAVLGTKYGAGDGSTTFNLPDLRGRFIRGTGGQRGGPAEPRNGQTGGGVEAGRRGHHRRGARGYRAELRPQSCGGLQQCLR